MKHCFTNQQEEQQICKILQLDRVMDTMFPCVFMCTDVSYFNINKKVIHMNL